MIALTAAGLDSLSAGRFILGLGASAPWVMEGFHGVRCDKPMGRTSEIVDICRQIWKREDDLVREGPLYHVPLADGEGTELGKPLKIVDQPLRSAIPVYVASRGEKNVELTAEIADGATAILRPRQGGRGLRDISALRTGRPGGDLGR
jgi:alkanesulfonate monooxygenase SsuD/methylene tetrahydromethanopterin reductase-like flavin-dependent oxidoreductase (luciferase family)